MAMNVPSSRMPLPHESFRSGNSSGSEPYFAGPKMALCVPIRKTPASSRFLFHAHKPASTSSMMNNSKTFTPSITERLLKRSARNPPAIENKMNGSANSAAMDSPQLFFSASVRFAPKSVTKTTRFFTTLSLNAPWNCVTMSAQKPRDDCGFWTLDCGFMSPTCQG